MQTLQVAVRRPGLPADAAVDLDGRHAARPSQESFDPILFTDHETDRTVRLAPAALPARRRLRRSPTTTAPTGCRARAPALARASTTRRSAAGRSTRRCRRAPPIRTRSTTARRTSPSPTAPLSVDGGLTFGPAVPIYNLQAVRGSARPREGRRPTARSTSPTPPASAPSTRTRTAIAVSEDNGVTWTVRTVPGHGRRRRQRPVGGRRRGGPRLPRLRERRQEPGGGRVGRPGPDLDQRLRRRRHGRRQERGLPGHGGGRPRPRRHGVLRHHDDGRRQQLLSEGVWHLYVAHTYDGGASWITVNATPNDPLQRGGIHLGGGSEIHRNLLDFFDADVDAQGRMVVGYADGCLGACVQSPDSAPRQLLHGLRRRSRARRAAGGCSPSSIPPSRRCPARRA